MRMASFLLGLSGGLIPSRMKGSSCSTRRGSVLSDVTGTDGFRERHQFLFPPKLPEFNHTVLPVPSHVTRLSLLPSVGNVLPICVS